MRNASDLAALIHDSAGSWVPVFCIAIVLDLITATLACTQVFARELGPCCICNETKQVISAVKSGADPKPPATTTGKVVEFSRPLGIVPRAERKI